jgi:hypothetical protein
MTEDKKAADGEPAGVSDSTQLLGTCGHFCEACARRDDEITRLRNLVRNFADVVEVNAFAMTAPNAHTPIFVQLAITARNALVPNAALTGAADKPTGNGAK